MSLKNHNKTALVWHDNEISYESLLQRISHTCTFFEKSEYRHVLICAENRPEWVYCFFAAWRLNAAVIPVDFMNSVSDVEYIIGDCKPELIIYSDTTREVVLDACKGQQHEMELFNLEKLADAEPGPDLQNLEPRYPQADADKTALLIYTSGTTGSPKGVMLSYDNLAANIESVSDEIPIYTRSDRVMVLLPLHHIFPLLGSMVAPLTVGATIVFSPSLTPEDMMATLEKHGINIVIGVPRLYTLISRSIMGKIQSSVVGRILFSLASTINSLTFSRKLFGKVQQKFGGEVRFLISGGAKLDEETGHNLRVLGFEILEGFGMTEAAPMITFTRPGEVLVGSAGKPMSCNEVKTVDGEIVARGRNIMQGYYNRPEETTEVLKDGWLHTGDLGHFDEDNNIHITGRRKEIIVLSSGKNINPVEIEHKLEARSDLIAEAGVFLNDNVLQVVIFPDFARLHEEKITNIEEHFRNRVIDPYNQEASPYKRLLKLNIIQEELPKTRLGKLKRFLLHNLMETAGQHHKEAPIPEGDEYNVISGFLAEQKARKIYPNDHLALDLGLDSLDMVSFATFLQSTFGVDISEEVLSKHPTVAKIAVYIEKTKQHVKVSVIEWSEILHEQIEHKLPDSWIFHNMIKNLSRLLLKVYFRLDVRGLDKLPDSPFIIAPNHQSFLDGLFAGAFLNNAVNKNTYFFAKAKHIQKGWLKFLAERNNIVVVDIDNDLKQSIQQLSAILKQGKNIIIFPEGTRTRDGRLREFKKTFAILSSELQVPIVPVAIDGAYAALPSGSHIPKPRSKIEVTFLEPVWPENLSYEALSARVKEQISSVLKDSGQPGR